jgi:hypothetical protein
MNIRPVEDGQTDVTKLTAAFRNFAKGPKAFNITNKYDFPSGSHCINTLSLRAGH